MMRSKVANLAEKKGIPNPQQLSYSARITWPTANQVWDGDLSKTRGETLRKLAAVLGCSIDDLFVYEDTEHAA